MTSTKVSVLMPVFNTEPEYLSEAIDSILSQSFTQFELLIYDDCSSREDTLSTLEHYAASDSRIRLVHGEKNGGEAVARNRLLSLASYPLCANMDSDDISLPLRLEKQVAFMEKHPDVGICGTWFHRFPSDTYVRGATVPGYLDLLRENCLGNPTLMFNRDLFRKYGIEYDESFRCCVDYDAYSRAARCFKIANLPEVLLEYRERPDSLCHIDYTAVRNSDWHIHRKMLDFLTRRGPWRDGVSSMVALEPSEERTPAAARRESFLSRFWQSVIVRLDGGLGDQMFQYAIGCARSEEAHRRLRFDVVSGKSALDVFGLEIPHAGAGELRRASRRGTVVNLPLGYCQKECSFAHLRPYLEKAFAFPSFALEDTFNQTVLMDIRLSDNPVFVHVRGGDYVTLGWALGPDYYSAAAQYMVSHLKNPDFFVFGDYDEGIMDALKAHSRKVEWVGDENARTGADWKDMALMASCRHAIVANSTFSWWAAWLGEAFRGIVTAPSPFLDGTQEGIAEGWVKIPRK